MQLTILWQEIMQRFAHVEVVGEAKYLNSALFAVLQNCRCGYTTADLGMVVDQYALEQPFGVRVQNGLEFDTAGAELGSLRTRRLSLFGTPRQRG